MQAILLTMVRDFLAHAHHGLVENGLRQRHTATTACPYFRTGLDLGDCSASAILHAVDHIAFGDVVTGTDLRTVIPGRMNQYTPRQNWYNDTHRSSAFSSPPFCAPRINWLGGISSSFWSFTIWFSFR
jgi:hypothetical protein